MENQMTMGLRTQLISLVCSVLIVGALGASRSSVSAQAPTCTQTLSAGADVAAVVSSAAAGATICLGAGNYTFSATISKSSMTKVAAAPGLNNTQVTITSGLDLGTSNNLWFDNITAGPSQTDWGTGSGSPTNIKATNIRFTGPVCINAHLNNSNVLVDNSTFIGLGESCQEGRLSIKGSSSGDNGITISNNEFSGGNSDAIQLVSNARGTVIGPGNYFHDITSCSVHCDAIQPYGAINTTITGNYFGGNLDGIIADFDCNGSPLHLINNVFNQGTGSAQSAVAISGTNGDTLIHNTFSASTEVQIYGGNLGCSNTSVTMRDNVMRGGCSITGSGHTISNNLVSGGGACVGANGISGSPIFVGGANPATWAGFMLTAASLGHLAASDGLDTGARTFGGSTGIPANPKTLRVLGN
jgi:hypothetical protein